MTMQKWDPFRNFRHFDNVMSRFQRNYGPRIRVQRAESWAIPLDVVQDDDNVTISASLPGFKAEGIHVTIEDGVLAISAETTSETEDSTNGYMLRERRAGKFYRAIRLPETVDADKAESGYNEGVLTITLPRIETKKAKKLEVKVG
ncbi:MAG: Hsp20/alpha crystallin family protein [Chloroflexi bacterium]|nr:Hsp20/alpha crystallin family protein [Chloroflexota bacterium]